MALRVFLLGVGALAGEQIVELLQDNPLTEATEIKLFDTESRAGQSLMVGGKANRVALYESADFTKADLVLLCAPNVPELVVQAAVSACTLLDLHHHAATEDAELLVAEINAPHFTLKKGAIYRSPEPSLLATALFLKALDSTRANPLRLTANIICPASLHDQAGVLALAKETSMLLNGREASDKLLDAFLAFNVLAMPQPVDAAGEMPIERLYRDGLPRLSDEELEVSVTAVQAPLFHGTAVTLVIENQNRVEISQLTQAIDRQDKLRYTEAKSASTQSVTGVDECMVSRLRFDVQDDRIIKLTLLFDEQRLGRASNAVALIGSLTTMH